MLRCTDVAQYFQNEKYLLIIRALGTELLPLQRVIIPLQTSSRLINPFQIISCVAIASPAFSNTHVTVCGRPKWQKATEAVTSLSTCPELL